MDWLCFGLLNRLTDGLTELLNSKFQICKNWHCTRLEHFTRRSEPTHPCCWTRVPCIAPIQWCAKTTPPNDLFGLTLRRSRGSLWSTYKISNTSRGMNSNRKKISYKIILCKFSIYVKFKAFLCITFILKKSKLSQKNDSFLKSNINQFKFQLNTKQRKHKWIFKMFRLRPLNSWCFQCLLSASHRAQSVHLLSRQKNCSNRGGVDLDLWKPFKDENPLLKFSVDGNGGQDNKQHQEVVPENEQNENERIMKKWQILWPMRLLCSYRSTIPTNYWYVKSLHEISLWDCELEINH